MVAGLQMSCSQHQGCRCCQGMGNFLWGRCLWTTCASWCLLGVMVSIQSRNSGPLPKVRCFLHAEKEPHNTMLYQFKSIYHWICQSIGISWKVALWLYIYMLWCCTSELGTSLEHLRPQTHPNLEHLSTEVSLCGHFFHLPSDLGSVWKLWRCGVCGTCDVHHSCAPHALHDRQGLVQGEQGFEENIIIIYIYVHIIFITIIIPIFYT